MTDKGLKQLIEEELDFEPSIDAADIGIAVENGIVTLSGHVPSYAQKTKIEEIVGRIKGVRGYAEEIEVRFPG
jgi:osmotically-inducible protein OsmY